MRHCLFTVLLLSLLLSTSALADSFAPVMRVLTGIGEVESAGSSYSTSIRISNRQAIPQLVRVDWLGPNGDGSKIGVLTIELGPNATKFIGAISHLSGRGGIGTAQFTAVLENGEADREADFEVEATVFSARKSDRARLSQVVRGLSFDELRGESLGDPLGMIFYPVMIDAVSRANFGLVNGSLEPETFVIEVRHFLLGMDEERAPVLAARTVTVPAFSTIQAAVPEPDAEGFIEGATWLVNIHRVTNHGGYWNAYVSNVDRQSLDAVHVLPLSARGRLRP